MEEGAGAEPEPDCDEEEDDDEDAVDAEGAEEEDEGEDAHGDEVECWRYRLVCQTLVENSVGEGRWAYRSWRRIPKSDSLRLEIRSRFHQG